MNMQDLKGQVDTACTTLRQMGILLKDVEVNFNITKMDLDMSYELQISEMIYDLLNPNVVNINLS